MALQILLSTWALIHGKRGVQNHAYTIFAIHICAYIYIYIYIYAHTRIQIN